jgi:hypothetical protein
MEKENSNQELAKVIKIESVTVYDPEKLNRKLVTVKTVNDALKIAHDYPSKFPSLAKIRTHYGSEATERIIKLYLIELTELVNLKRPLTEKQIETIAMEVVARHFAMTIADVHVIFKKAINGEFGDFYESLDVPKVMKWFDLYFDERCEIGAQDSINSQFYDKGGNMTSGRMTTHFNNLQKQMTKK